MASACSPRALRCGPMAMQWHRYVRPAPAVARRPGRSVKGPHEGRQSEGVWITIARDSLSRRNGKLYLIRARPGCPAPSPTASPEAALPAAPLS